MQDVKRVLDLNCTRRRIKQFNFFNWLSNVKNVVLSNGSKQGCKSLLSIGGGGVICNFTPILPYFQPRPRFSSGEQIKWRPKKRSSPKMEQFFPRIHVDTYAHTPESNYWGGCRWRPYSNYWGGYSHIIGWNISPRVSAPLLLTHSSYTQHISVFSEICLYIYERFSKQFKKFLHQHRSKKEKKKFTAIITFESIYFNCDLQNAKRNEGEGAEAVADPENLVGGDLKHKTSKIFKI